ncbi:hypothetical protein SeMB42_g02969 [Synchytrium endobioticum]|uniref:Uncharacterized protein n=1 Tax=Synchytrium endobioticum TaxID=286115 RepID=A0A507DAF5_9FUNG|nr:hypothetical protein SeMB42_g02969 [Synchytrium endobioticum]
MPLQAVDQATARIKESVKLCEQVLTLDQSTVASLLVQVNTAVNLHKVLEKKLATLRVPMGQRDTLQDGSSASQRGSQRNRGPLVNTAPGGSMMNNPVDNGSRSFRGGGSRSFRVGGSRSFRVGGSLYVQNSGSRFIQESGSRSSREIASTSFRGASDAERECSSKIRRDP